MSGIWYINSNGKKIYGAAAEQHTIKANGGWEQHHKKVIAEALNEIVPKLQSMRPPEQRKLPIPRMPHKLPHQKSFNGQQTLFPFQ